MSGIGLTAPILGIHASPPPYGLLKSLPAEYIFDAGSLPMSPLNEDNAAAGRGSPGDPTGFGDTLPGGSLAAIPQFYDTSWEAGFQWEPERGALTLDAAHSFPYWWDCPEGAGATAAATVTGNKKPVQLPLPLRTYRPYTAHAADSASTIGFAARDRAARAARMLDSNLSRIIEFEFWRGAAATAAGFPNDFLEKAPTQLNGGASTGYMRALSELEQAIAENENGPTSVIHAQPRVVSLWASNDRLTLVPGTARLITKATGNIVIAGTGYPGTGPGTALVDSTSAASWAYATDMPRVAISRMFGIPNGGRLGEVGADAFDRTVNDGIYRAERVVACFFDATVKHGIKVNLTSAL